MRKPSIVHDSRMTHPRSSNDSSTTRTARPRARVLAYITDREYAALHLIASVDGVGLSALLREAVRQYLTKRKWGRYEKLLKVEKERETPSL